MRSVVLAPWRGGDPDRERSWTIVRSSYAATGLELFVGDSGHRPFSLAASVNEAARAAGDWDIAVIINTDCLVSYPQLMVGLTRTEATGRVTLPHDSWCKLHRGRVPLSAQVILREDYMIAGIAPAGCIIMPRPVWDRIGGYDERFQHWGFEDAALLRKIGSFDRLAGPLYHYWHTKRRDTGDPVERRIWAEEYKHLPLEQVLVTSTADW